MSEALRLRVLSLYDRHLAPDGRALDYKALSADPGLQQGPCDSLGCKITTHWRWVSEGQGHWSLGGCCTCCWLCEVSQAQAPLLGKTVVAAHSAVLSWWSWGCRLLELRGRNC